MRLLNSQRYTHCKLNFWKTQFWEKRLQSFYNFQLQMWIRLSWVQVGFTSLSIEQKREIGSSCSLQHSKEKCFLYGLVHTYRQNPWLSIDKSPILSVDCFGTNATWSGTFCQASTLATCPWTIAELCLWIQVCDFVYRYKFAILSTSVY